MTIISITTAIPAKSSRGSGTYAAIPSDSMVTTVYAADGTTQFLALSTTNKPMQVPQSDGTTLLFYVHKSGSPPSTDVTFSAVPGPTSPIPVGAIFVNDDTDGFPAAVITPSGGGFAVLSFVDINATGSENGGDVLDDGTVLLTNENDGNFARYNGQLVLQGTVTPFVAGTASVVKTCVTPQVWYVGDRQAGAAGKAILAKIDASGTVVQTWTLPNSGMACMAASNDETIIYVVGQSSGTAVKKWLTGSSTFQR